MFIFFRKFDEINKKLNNIDRKTNDLLKKIETKHIAEYLELMNNNKKLIWRNFISGVAKGIGIAVGFSLLGAIAIYLLRQIVMLNLPVIGAFIRDIMDIVEKSNK